MRQEKVLHLNVIFIFILVMFMLLLYLLQDFALDPEMSRMHVAAIHMVRHLTAGMAMITCREPLLLSICNNLKSSFSSVLRVRTSIQILV